MIAYYNEIDPFCAQWLRNLIAAGHIAPGEVDVSSSYDISELVEYYHFEPPANQINWLESWTLNRRIVRRCNRLYENSTVLSVFGL